MEYDWAERQVDTQLLIDKAELFLGEKPNKFDLRNFDLS